MQFISDNLRWLTVLVIGISAAVFWVGVPPPAAPEVLPSAAEPWQLPKLAQADAKQSAAEIAARNLWGIVAPVEQAALNTPEWRFAGVARRGAERHVLIKIEGKPVEVLKIGDTLPGGAKILKVEDDRLCVLINGERRALGVNRQ